jgi:peptidoglycan/xylan/chitin deacetylase (PgdA/CDA1 family)
MKNTGAKSLPVAMYHYVNEVAGAITVSPACFEEHCRVLAEKGWRGVGLDEAEEFLIDGVSLPEKTLLLTFDDGFLDNYLFALPSLNKYGHKAVVFAVSNRLEAGTRARVPFADALEGRGSVPDNVARPMEKTGQGFTIRRDIFLNHAEVREMDGNGIFRAASHSRGHYGVYTGPEYEGFFRPRPQGRTFYRTEREPVWGMPEFPVRPGLLHRAFLPSPDLTAAIRDLVPQNFDGAAAFFANAENIRELEALAAKFRGNLGRFENDVEREERMWREIAGGKAELEAILGHKVRTLCWPWGAYGEEARQLALDAGFRLFFTTREGANPPRSPLAVCRFKAKSKSGTWLASRARVYASPLFGTLYARIRI